MLEPRALSNGSARFSDSASPPTRNTSCALSACGVLPNTIASSSVTPALLVTLPSSWTHAGVRVELSIAMAPVFAPASAPFDRSSQTCREASSLLTMAMIKSLPSAASLGVAAAFAPDAASLLAASGVRFQTVSSCPAFSRFAAIREPIAPSPRNATLLIFDSPRDPNGRRLNVSFSIPSPYRTKLRKCFLKALYPDRLGIYKSMQSEVGKLPAIPAVLDSTDWHPRV